MLNVVTHLLQTGYTEAFEKKKFSIFIAFVLQYAQMEEK